MRGGFVGSFCFLAFLLSSGAKGQNVLNSQDLQGLDSDGPAENIAVEHKRDVSNDKTSIQDDNNVGERSNALLAANGGSGQGFTGVPNWSVPSNTGSSHAQASTNAQATGNTGGNNPGLGYGYPSSNAANSQAATNAQASGISGRYNPGLGYGYPGSDAANSQATASVHSLGDAAESNAGLGYGQSTNKYSDANALTNAGGAAPNGYQGWRQDGQDKTRAVVNVEEKNDVDADHEMPDFERMSRMGGSFGEYSNYGAFSGAVSRVVSQAEYIYPDLLPGGQNAVTCSRDHEIHTIWSPIYQCLVCVCVQEGWTLRPICVSCNSCATKPTPKPQPSPPPSIVIPPPPPPPLIPESQVSCSPLPTNTPFENPLNPCQTCICKKVVNVFGQEDVQIKCEENPSCITPPEYVPIPPLSPKPVPMPLCESLPANVQFPHPTEPCTVCKCVVEMSPYLIPERRMTCQHDFENCGPTPTIPPPLPPVTDYPIMVYPPTPPPQPTPPPYLPEIIRPTEIEPMPWPPIVEPLPRPPSPLPGPPPHDTCKPYPPNTPFQHPWDECQICVCSEIYGNNVVNIEVNCYTKKSCCIEPPIKEPPLTLPYKPVPQLPPQGLTVPSSYGHLIFIEPKCRYRAPKEPYVVDCSICTCETVYQYVYAKCVPQPNCGQLPPYGPYGLLSGYLTGQSSAQAQAEAISSAQSGLSNQYPYSLGGQSSAQAQAEAAATSQSGLSNLYPYSLGGLSSAQAQADAAAIFQSGLSNQYPYSLGGQSSAQAQAEAAAISQSGLSNQYPYSLGGQSSAQAQAEAAAISQSGSSNQYPYSLGGQSSAQAQAEAAAISQSGLSNQYPYSLGGQSSAQAQAEAAAISQSGLSNQYPYSLGGQSSAQAQADAAAISQSGLSNQYPYSLGGQSSAQAQAEAAAISQSGLSNQYPYSLGGQSSAQAQAEAAAISQSGLSNQYPYSLGGQSSAQAQAAALANAQSELFNQYPYSLGGQSSAQAQAEAAASTQSSNLFPYGIYGQGGQSSAQAQADALAQSGSLSPYGVYGQGAQSSAQAQAEALASAQTVGMSPYGSYPYSQAGQSTAQSQAEALGSQYSMLHPFLGAGGSQSSAQAQAEAIASSQMYPSLYPHPSGNIGSLYHPGINGWDSTGQSQAVASAQAQAQSDAATQALLFGGSSANAQSQAMALGSGATAQSLAQAAAMSGRPLIKSGKGLCKYAGDKYHHNCQACYCIGEASGKIYTLCLGNPCSS